MKKLLLAFCAMALAFVSCTDLEPLYEKIDGNTARIDALEKKSNDLENLIKAVQKNVFVTSVEKTEEGYKITFSDGTSANLKNGDKGDPGAAAATPSFKVDDAGIIYVSLDKGNTWSALGNIKGPKGDNAKDGLTPQFKVEESVLYIRYSDTAEWTSLGSLKGDNGEDGASPLFKLDNATGDLYVRYSESEEWTLVGNARGEVWIKSIQIEDGYLKIVTNDNHVYNLFMSCDTLRDLKFVPEYNDGLATLNYFDSSNASPMKLSFTVGGDKTATDLFFNYVYNGTNDFVVDILAAPVKTRATAVENVYSINVNVSDISRDRFMLDRYDNYELYTITLANPASLLAGSGETINLVEGCYELAIRIQSRYNGSNCARSEFFQIHKECLLGTLEYAGETYRTVKMADGRWWMAENLRYVPAGITPSSDPSNVTAGVFCPVVYDGINDAAKFGTAPEDIAANGYLYQAEVAFGLNIGDITTPEQAAALEGTQGICPDGWYIPTIDDIAALVGKTIAPFAAKSNTKAPYYINGNGSLQALNNDFFNLYPCGTVSIADNTKTSGSLVGKLSGYTSLTSGMYLGSSYATNSPVDKEDLSKGYKNFTFAGLMPMTNKADASLFTCNHSNVGYRIGASVRCVKRAE